jgi:hypothetical protein
MHKTKWFKSNMCICFHFSSKSPYVCSQFSNIYLCDTHYAHALTFWDQSQSYTSIPVCSFCRWITTSIWVGWWRLRPAAAVSCRNSSQGGPCRRQYGRGVILTMQVKAKGENKENWKRPETVHRRKEHQLNHRRNGYSMLKRHDLLTIAIAIPRVKKAS